MYDNRSYSLITEGTFSRETDNGGWNIGARYNLKTLHQTSGGTDGSKLNYQTVYLYGDYSGKWNRLAYTLGVGVEDTKYDGINDASYNYLICRPFVSLNYQSGASSWRLTSQVPSQVPSVGMLAESPVYLDERYISVGNPRLKPYYYYHNRLDFRFAPDHNQFYVSSSLTFSHSVNMYEPMLIQGEEYVMKKYEAVKSRNYMQWGVAFSRDICRWLSLNAYYSLSNTHYQTHELRVDHTSHFARFGAQFNFKNLVAVAQINTDLKYPEGDFMVTKGAWAFSSVTWRHKDISVGARFQYSPHEESVAARTSIMNYKDALVWRNYNSMVDLTFSYFFRKGKAKQYGNKKLFNGDNDSGLVKDNTAK